MSDPLGYFIGQGWSPQAAAGIVGNLYGESGLNPAAVGDGGKAYGIAQWHPDRQANFARVMGRSIVGSTVEQQLQFVNWELNNTESKAGGLLRKASSVADATKTFMTAFERPANLSSLNKRISAAQDAISGALKNKLGSAARIAANTIMPGSGEVLNSLGLIPGGGKSWIQQFQEWLANSHFWQRIALGVLALIFLGGAIYLLGSKQIKSLVK